jgi:GT2 family glycosyltransferase
MDLSIIIVNWNTVGLLSDCLKAIYDHPASRSFEVIVVDNASTDGSPAMVRQDFPGARLIENSENVGFARANNQAIRESRGGCILLLNSDAFVDPVAISYMLRAMYADPSVGIVGANLFYPDGSPQLSHGPLPSLGSEVQSLFGLDKDGQITPQDFGESVSIETGYTKGACMLLKREMLDQIGLLDERFYFYSEEIDLCCRAHQAGWKVVHSPSAKVIHVGGGSAGPSANRYLMLYQAKLNYFAKHHSRSSQRLLYSAMRISAYIKAIVYSSIHRVKPGNEAKDILWRKVAAGLGGLHI